jgi:hypothetical protein
MNESWAMGRPGEDPREVGQLEGQRALPAGIAEAGGGVDDQTETAQTRLSFYSRDDVVGQLDPLQRAPEAELAGVDHEALPRLHQHLLGEVVGRVAQVDRRGAVVVEDPEGVAHAQVHGGGLEETRIPGVDGDPPLSDEAQDRAVGEDGAGRRGHVSKSGKRRGSRLPRESRSVLRQPAADGARAHPRRGWREGNAVGVAPPWARAARAATVRMRAHAPAALIARRRLGLGLYRPVHEPEQHDDRDLQDEHQVQEGPGHGEPRWYSRRGATSRASFIALLVVAL